MPTSPRRTARIHVPQRLAAVTPRRITPRSLLAVGVLGLTVVVALAVALTRPAPQSSPGPVIPVARARAYSAHTACLLTAPGGTRDAAAAAVWAGMQAASATTHAQVSSLAMQGPDTSDNADVYINTLALRGCSIVLAAGQSPAQGALQRAAAWPNLPIIAVPGTSAGDSGSKVPHNLTVVSSSTGKALIARIQALVTAADRSVSDAAS